MRNGISHKEIKPTTPARSRRTPAERQFIASLAHGLEVLEALAEAGSDVSLATVAAQVGRSKPTVWRLIHTLVKLGYVRQDPETRHFALSPRILSFGACFEGMDLKELAAPYLRALSARLGETVNMAVLDDMQLIYVDRIKSSQIVNINLHVGSRLPLYNTSMGRALLAHRRPEELRAYLARLREQPEAEAFTAQGGRRLLEILADVRRRGYAINDEELVTGLRSVGCPVWDGRPQVVAAINISVPSVRVSARNLKTRYAPELMRSAAQISAALGYRGVRREVS